MDKIKKDVTFVVIYSLYIVNVQKDMPIWYFKNVFWIEHEKGTGRSCIKIKKTVNL